MARPQEAPLEIVEGSVEKMNFSNEATGFAVVRISVKTEAFPVTAVGTLATLRIGEEVRFSGYWKTDPKFGRQFVVEDYVPSVPVDVQAIEKYLSSGLVKGIGKEMAKRIVKTFGPKTIEVIDQRPERLEKVEGIGPKRRELIQKSWAEQKAVREVMIFLQGVGVSPAYAIRIYRKYGAGSQSKVKADPYILAREVHGIGFKIADKIARDLGFDVENPKRLEAGTTFTLWEAQSDGHIYLPETELINKASQLLDVPFRLVEEALDRLIEGGWLRAEPLMTGERGVYQPILRDHEMMAAKRLVALMRGAKIDPSKMSFPSEVIAQAQALSDGQQEALKRSITSPVSIITGGPGTGKTTMVKALLSMFEAKGTKTMLAAPTGRAAKRLEQSTGRAAKTIHRLLEFNPKEGKFTRNAANPIEADALILDEASMIDLPLARALLEAVRPGAQFCLVGDVDQLPSVGPGLFLADSIRSAAIPVSRLNEVFRQAAQSQIVNAAHSILKGKYPISGSEGSDFFIIERNDPAKAIETIKELVTKRIPNKFGFDPKNDIQVLAPMHRGVVGVENINLELQAALNPGGASLGPGSRGLKVGDKVMQVKNDYDKDVYNGDVGFIEGMSEDDGLVAVRFDERTVFYPVADLDELHLAYSLSIHKCVAGYGLAHVDGRGLVPVSAVKIGEKIQTGQHGARKILDFIPTGEKEIVRIRTKHGYSLDVSKEHPILVADQEKGPHFKTAQELQLGDYACIDRSLVEGREVVLPEIEYGGKQQKRLTPPKTLTAEFAWALGVIVGDGSCRDKKDGLIDVTSQDPELLDRYQHFWEGVGLHIGRAKKANHERAFFYSRPLRAWLAALGLGFWLAVEKRTPALIFEAPAEVRASYLRGLFDTDGSAGKIGLRFTSASERLTREVQALLLSLGIVSSQYSEGPEHFKVGITGTSVPLYQDRVGFVVEHKQKKLQKLAARAKGKTTRDIIPFGAGLMGAYKETLPASMGRVGEGLYANQSVHLGFVGRVLNGDVRLNYHHIRELENYKYPLTEGLREVLQSNYFYDEIESIERLTEQTEMFDLEVEDKHSFVVGGFVCHNSQGSEYPAVVLPMLTQHFVMLQRNLFYTAVTRGKKLVVVVGDPRAIRMAVKNDKPQERYSRLIERLREEATAL